MPWKGRCLRFMASGYMERSMCDACISVRRDYPNESVRLTPYQANSKCFHDTFSIFQDSSFFSKKQLPFLLTSEIFLLFLHFSEKIQCCRQNLLFNFPVEAKTTARLLPSGRSSCRIFWCLAAENGGKRHNFAGRIRFSTYFRIKYHAACAQDRISMPRPPLFTAFCSGSKHAQ